MLMRNSFTLITLLLCIFSYQNLLGQCDITLSDDSPCALIPVTFTVDNPSGSYGWDLDGDGFIDAFGTSVTYTFPASNIDLNYTVTIFQNGQVCNTEDVLVSGLPDSSFGVVPGSGILEGSLIRVCSGSPQISLEIYNSSTSYASNQSYEINWGDGTIENLDNTTFPNTSSITHDYNAYGYYNISITTTSINGCTNVGYYTLYNGSNPSVGLANPGNTVGICAPATIDFPITNTGSNPTGTIYTIYVSGEVVALYTQENVPSIFSYNFLESSCGQTTGTGNYQNAYDVQILASNPCGSSQATIEPIELSSPPEVSFSSDEPDNGCESQTYTFTNTSGNLAEVIAGNCTNLAPSWSITPGIPGVHWEIVTGNQFDSDEIQVIFLIPGEYTVEMTINSPSCGAGTFSQTLNVLDSPDATVDGGLISASVPATSDECMPSIGIFTNNSTGDSLTFEWDISPSTGWNYIDTFNQNSTDLQVMFVEAGEYNVSLAASNECGTDVWDTLLVVADVPEVDINPIPNQCGSAVLNFTTSMVDINANFGTLSSIEWSFPGAVPSTSSATYPSNIYYENPGTYTIEVTIENQCGTNTTSETFEIEPIGNISAPADTTICENAPGFTLVGNPVGGIWSGAGVFNDGDFDPSVANIGDNLLVYTLQDGACTLEDTTIVTIIALPVVDAGEDEDVCINSGIINLSATPVGGNWSIDNGGVLTGGNNFDPMASGLGVYTLTYTFTDMLGCANQDSKVIMVNDLPTVEAGPNQSICENPIDIELQGATPNGGEWSGPGVTNGSFNAASIGQGVYTLYYNFTDATTGCANLDSITMTVTPNESAEAGPDDALCLNANPFELLTGTPVGGYWTGPGVDSLTNVFDPEAAGVGTHTLTYVLGTGVCQTNDSKVIAVLEIPSIALPNEQLLCINDLPYDLSAAAPSGGVWSGSGINGDTFDPAVAGVGVHSITYTYTDPNGGCSNSETIEMEVVPLPNIIANDTSYCNTSGAVDLPAAFPLGGEWSGVGVVGNTFNPFLAGGVGTYNLVYTFSDSNNCENYQTVVITVVEPEPVNAGNDFEICIDAQKLDLGQLASPFGGTWYANGSLGLNGTQFNPATAGIGTHVLTYTIGEGNCQVSDDIEIVVNGLPSVETMPDFNICSSESNVVLEAAPLGGMWTATNGAILVGNVFNANLSGEGTFEFTYSYTDGNGCENSDDLLVTVYGLPPVSANDTTYCFAPGLLDLPLAQPAGGTWSGPGINNGMFDPVAAGGLGEYTLEYVFIDDFYCQNTAIATITIIPLEEINAGLDDTLCIDQGLTSLANYSPANGVWSGPGIVDANAGIIDPMQAGSGVHTLVYSFGTGNCLVEDEKLVTIIDLEVDAGPDLSSCFTYETFSLSGYSPAGGSWSGPGIVDAINGLVNPAVANPGSHTLVYTFTDPITGCVRSDERLLEIFPMEEAAFDLPSLACRTEPVQFQNLSNPNYEMSWDFGLGAGTSTAINPVHTYDVAGVYTVQLIVENEFGCKDTVEHQIIIADTPGAFFEPDVSEGCSDFGFEFTNESFGDSLSYLWQFGDFQTSTDEDPGLIYFEPGLNDTTYLVTLTVSNICGEHTYQDLILVHPLPNADFGILPLTDCSPLLVDFANASTGTITEYFWDFGNGNTSNEQFPATETYFTDSVFSIYNVVLITTNECGMDTATAEVLVQSANVIAAAEASVEAGCVPLTVDFTNFSSATATIDWDFGDGNTSSLTEPTHTFSEPGEYTVIQFAASDCGYDTMALNITVYPAPEVSFEHTQTICSGQEVEFLNTSTNTSGNFWDFGDGETSALNNPSHVYNTPGEYTITLTGVSMFNQCEAIYTSTITVLDLPAAIFEPSTVYGCAPLDVSFANYSTNAQFYQWNFGDGNTSIDETPSHVFEEPGTYEVQLMATDLNGCFEDFTIFNITVRPKPEALFDYERSQSCGLPAVINFENLSEGGEAFEWSFGEGTTSVFTNPVHTYTEAGVYEVLLVANNQFDCTDSTFMEIEIFENPSAGVEIESMDGCAPLEVSFNNTSSSSNEYLWDFGDGTTSTESDPIHLYENSGDYEVQLIANINGACADTITLSDLIHVYENPMADFEAFEIENDGTYEMTNLSINADTYYWEFSDGSTSDLENPEHRFLTNGVHQIYLEASNEFGCVDDTIISFTPDFVKGLFLPNGFSPEQGIGDVRLFAPKGIGLKEYHVQVFSTYGQLLWESKELDDQGRPTEAWDGVVDGRLMPQDVYVWKCSGIFQDGSNWKGERDKNGNYKVMGSLVLLR